MPRERETSKIYDKCVSALGKFVHEAGFEEVVLGLSGGIDSALVATMAVDALGCENVHGILLPGPFSSDGSIKDALKLAGNLGIEAMTIPIDGAYDAFAKGFADAVGKELSGLASENTQARCRMVYIMALSNSEGWLMLNTGNKSEAAMGYSTLYGDTAGAFAPIGDVYKTEVFALARWRNEQAEREELIPPIPKQIISKPPSAELSSGQTDESSMGITYEDLDAILKAYLEEEICEERIEERGFSRSQIDMVINRYRSYAFKRALEPPVAAI